MVKSLPALPYTSIITIARPWESGYDALTNAICMPNPLALFPYLIVSQIPETELTPFPSHTNIFPLNIQ